MKTKRSDNPVEKDVAYYLNDLHRSSAKLLCILWVMAVMTGETLLKLYDPFRMCIQRVPTTILSTNC